MFTFVHTLSLKKFTIEQVPTLGLSLIIAELFYKLHSFTLECIAFLLTWYLLDAARKFLTQVIRDR
jgi:hypothetical protein